MGTKVYGASDDLIEGEGDLHFEVGCYGTDEDERGVLLIFSDGTMLEAKYGKGGKGIWAVNLIRKGDLFVAIDPCVDEDATIYSDVALFEEGLKDCYAAKDWQLAQ